MKKFLIMSIVMVLAINSFSQLKVDTIINDGSGRVVIIDKRPKTVVNNNKPQTQPTVIVNIPENRDLENYLYYQSRIPVQDNSLRNLAIFCFLFAFVLLCGIGLYTLKLWNEAKTGGYNHSPVVNHFHVKGGDANLQVDKSMSNYESTKGYHKHTHMPPFVAAFGTTQFNKKPEEKSSRPATAEDRVFE